MTGISGRVTLDGGAMGVVAGALDEPGGGQYRLLPHAADTNGNVLGLYFTASGCLPVSFTVVTQQNISGRLTTISGLTYPASGAFTSVPPTTLSGVIANSGLFVTVPISTVSGVIVSSGTAPTIAEIADGLLNRSLATGASGGRTVQDALRFLRNRWTRTATTLTVYAENDSSIAWSSVLTSDATANPVTESDPP